MRKIQSKTKWFGMVYGLLMILVGCDYLKLEENEVNIPDSDDIFSVRPTPTHTGNPLSLLTPTPSPTSGDTSDFVVEEIGDRMEFNLGNVPEGTFHFEARGFDPNRYGGDTSQLKPVYFWLYNGLYDYECPGLLFEVRQLLYANYWCVGGKIKGRNNGRWYGEECYENTWDDEHWYSFDITWGDGVISLFIDGSFKQSINIGAIGGTVIAGVGWPPARRTGIIGLEYRNLGMQ